MFPKAGVQSLTALNASSATLACLQKALIWLDGVAAEVGDRVSDLIEKQVQDARDRAIRKLEKDAQDNSQEPGSEQAKQG